MEDLWWIVIPFQTLWANTFVKLAKKLQQLIPNISNIHLTFLADRVNNTFFLSPTSSEEIKREIKNLNTRKSSGPDKIGAKVLKLCPEIFAKLLSKIYNKSMEMGEYTTQLKIAKVIALFKKGQKTQPNNYCAINLLSCFDEIFEKILSKRLVKFLEINKILFKHQYGFLKLYSTTWALIEFTDKIIQYLDEGNYCISISIDLTKTFDTVDHEILQQKLEHYGIRWHANDFFRTYLTNRQQYMVINDAKSSLGKIECGVPQGSVLGPLLFTIYINDIQNAVGPEIKIICRRHSAIHVTHKFNTAFMWHQNKV